MRLQHCGHVAKCFRSSVIDLSKRVNEALALNERAEWSIPRTWINERKVHMDSSKIVKRFFLAVLCVARSQPHKAVKCSRKPLYKSFNHKRHNYRNKPKWNRYMAVIKTGMECPHSITWCTKETSDKNCDSFERIWCQIYRKVPNNFIFVKFLNKSTWRATFMVHTHECVLTVVPSGNSETNWLKHAYYWQQPFCAQIMYVFIFYAFYDIVCSCWGLDLVIYYMSAIEMK